MEYVAVDREVLVDDTDLGLKGYEEIKIEHGDDECYIVL